MKNRRRRKRKKSQATRARRDDVSAEALAKAAREGGVDGADIKEWATSIRDTSISAEEELYELEVTVDELVTVLTRLLPEASRPPDTKPLDLDDLLGRLQEMRLAPEDLVDAADSLTSEMSRFIYQEWAGDLDDAQEAMADALDEYADTIDGALQAHPG